MTINPKQFPQLARLVDQHEKNIEAFQAQATAFFHPYAVKLCRRIQRGIPEFEECQLAMRELYLEPRNHPVSITFKEDGETGDERLQNMVRARVQQLLDQTGQGDREVIARLLQRQLCQHQRSLGISVIPK